MRDRANEPLEQQLNEYLARLGEAARVLKVQREVEEERKRKWAAEEKAREEARQKAELEGARFRRVEHLAGL